MTASTKWNPRKESWAAFKRRTGKKRVKHKKRVKRRKAKGRWHGGLYAVRSIVSGGLPSLCKRR